MIDISTLGSRIRRFREQKGISGSRMAREMGCTQSTLSMWETGKFYPNLYSVIMVCNYLDVSPNELFGWKGEE